MGPKLLAIFSTPRKINGWNLKITCLKRKIIFQTSIIVFHVNFPGCTCWVQIKIRSLTIQMLRLVSQKLCCLKLFGCASVEFMDNKLVILGFLKLPQIAKLVKISLQVATQQKNNKPQQFSPKFHRLVLHVLFFKLVGQGPCGCVQIKVHKDYGYRNWTILSAAKEDELRSEVSKKM